jgi:hypothetical protein
MNSIEVLNSHTLTNNSITNSIINQKVFICSPRGTGKSSLIDSLIKACCQMIEYDIFIIVSVMERINPFYQGKYKNAHLFYHLNEDLADEFIFFCKNVRNALIILDDCIACDSTVMNKLQTFLNLENLTLFVTYQYPIFPNEIIDKCDFLLISNYDLPSVRKKLFKSVQRISMINDLSEFNTLINNLPPWSFLSVKNINKYFEIILNSEKEKETETESDTDTNTDDDSTEIENETLGENVHESIMVQQSSLNNLGIGEFNSDILNQSNIQNILVTGWNNEENANLIKNIISMVQHSNDANDIDYLVVVSEYNKDYYTDLTEAIYSKTTIIEKIVKRQKINKYKDHYAIILDTNLYNFKKDSVIQEILFNSRYYNITFIVVTRYPFAISPELRYNFDFVFAKTNLITDKKRLYDYYFDMYPDFETFKNAYDQICINNKTYIVACQRTSPTFFDKIKFMFVSNVQINKYPNIPYDYEEDKYTDNVCTDINFDECIKNNIKNKQISELKNKYMQQARLVASISVLMEQLKEELLQTKKLIDSMQNNE